MAKIFEFDDNDSTQVNLALLARIKMCEKFLDTDGEDKYWAGELVAAKQALDRFHALMEQLDALEASDAT